MWKINEWELETRIKDKRVAWNLKVNDDITDKIEFNEY